LVATCDYYRYRQLSILSGLNFLVVFGGQRMGTLVRRLAAGLGLGRLPEAMRAQLESEGRIVYLAEGVLETAIFRHYRAPGVRLWHRRIGFIGYLALSERRMVVKAKCYDEISINAAYDDAAFKKMTFTVRPGYLSLSFDASTQSTQASGQIEVRLHLPDIAVGAQILERAGARVVRE
jgi:hypothetical protein